MTHEPLRIAAAGIDLSGRLTRTATVAASPALAAETVIASLTVNDDVQTAFGVVLLGFAAWTVGTGGTAVTLKVRQTGTSGTTLVSTGARSATAGNLDSGSVVAVDTGPTLPGQVYVLTMTVTGGAAASTVSAVELVALAV